MPALTSPTSSNGISSAPVVTWRQWAAAGVIGIILSLLMWHGLLRGHDLNGGDTWPYFFPQKIVLADSFARNELPLWHDLTGPGYPLLAESQAGVYYPTNQILYRILDVNRAYYVSIILHYALAFLFTWRFARCQEISHWSALLVAMVFVYGWFPARISLEWSIIGGVWLPVTLWGTHEFLVRPSRWRFAVLTTCFGIHLLAGHFTLAFINQLCVLLYAGLQVVLRPANGRPSLAVAALIPAAILLSLVLSAAQLLPSMELKQISQREGTQSEFDPGYGHIPPVYFSQLIASWTWWHAPEIVQSKLVQRLPGSIDSDTNHVEAHFYLGLIPLGLASLCLLPLRRPRPHVIRRTWICLGAAGIVYATGWLLPITRHLPGFAYFMGPGRYTIVSTLAGAILSGMMLDSLFRRKWMVAIAALTIGTFTWFDLRWASQSVEDPVRAVADAVQVPEILSHQDESWIRNYFLSQPPRTCRLLTGGQNVGNLFGVSCVPLYLGIGPAVYFSDRLDLATQPYDEAFGSPVQMSRLRSLGVTHVLTTEPATQFNSVLTQVANGPDALLNRIWGRGGDPCYLYQLREPGRRLETLPADALVAWKSVHQTPEDITLEVTLSNPARVNFKELMYPGWKAEIDGKPAEVIADDDLSRSVQMSEGTHTLRWKFESFTVRLGGWVSCLTLVAVWLAPLVPLRRRQIEE